jgi:hypothetical protein
MPCLLDLVRQRRAWLRESAPDEQGEGLVDRRHESHAVEEDDRGEALAKVDPQR